MALGFAQLGSLMRCFGGWFFVGIFWRRLYCVVVGPAGLLFVWFFPSANGQ